MKMYRHCIIFFVVTFHSTINNIIYLSNKSNAGVFFFSLVFNNYLPERKLSGERRMNEAPG